MEDLKQKEIDMLVSQIAGEGTLDVARFIIANGENVSEFLIAESLKVPINNVRYILYKLQENNLITYTRKKDKKKGWYIYYWTFNHSQAKLTIKKMKENRIISIKNRLEREDTTKFYICTSKCLRLKFEHALENNFKCPECNKILKEQDNKKIIRALKRELSILEETSEVAEEPSAVEASA